MESRRGARAAKRGRGAAAAADRNTATGSTVCRFVSGFLCSTILVLPYALRVHHEGHGATTGAQHDAKHDLLSASRRARPSLLEPLALPGPPSMSLELGPTTVPLSVPLSVSAPPPQRLSEPAAPLQSTRPEPKTTFDRPLATATAAAAFDDAASDTATATAFPRERVAPWHPWWPCLTDQLCVHGKMSRVSLEAEDELSQLVVHRHARDETRGPLDAELLVRTAPREWAERELTREALESSVLEASLAYLRTGGTGM